MRNIFADLIETVRVALCKLHEIQFSAPWNPQAGGC